jgi:hypothetical protein
MLPGGPETIQPACFFSRRPQYRQPFRFLAESGYLGDVNCKENWAVLATKCLGFPISHKTRLP